MSEYTKLFVVNMYYYNAIYEIVSRTVKTIFNDLLIKYPDKYEYIDIHDCDGTIYITFVSQDQNNLYIKILLERNSETIKCIIPENSGVFSEEHMKEILDLKVKTYNLFKRHRKEYNRHYNEFNDYMASNKNKNEYIRSQVSIDGDIKKILCTLRKIKQSPPRLQT